MTEQVPSNHLDVEGCFNVRDAGGWPTDDGRRMATGVLYRADDPVRMSASGRRAIADLGLRAVVDLRQQAQYDRGYSFEDLAITHHVPLVDRVIDVDAPPPLDGPADLVDLYEDMVERGSAQIVRVVEVLATAMADGPVLVHCVAGKDRTGLIVALIQSAIGVTTDSIVAEYALSHEPSHRRRQAMMDTPLPDDPPVGRSPAMIWSAPAETMTLFAARLVERHGSMGAWPAVLGVPDATVDLLARLLEDAGLSRSVARSVRRGTRRRRRPSTRS